MARSMPATLEFDALGVEHAGCSRAFAETAGSDSVCSAPCRRERRQSHKGLFGRVLIIGGGAGMPGAVRLAGEAALRVGAGLVTVASRPEHLAVVVGARPELMFLRCADGRRPVRRR